MIEEIELKKISIYKTKINEHLFETIFSFIETNKESFTQRSWDCNIKTSKNIYENILYDVEEFHYIKKAINEQIENFYLQTFKKSIPFYIIQSWLNILQENGYPQNPKTPLLWEKSNYKINYKEINEEMSTI